MLVHLSALLLQVSALTGAQVQARIDQDLAASQPVVAHVVVALCDNRYQGIVPVSKTLGDGQNPRTNLYWGAAYGVHTYFSRANRYKTVDALWDTESSVLEKVVFQGQVRRDQIQAPLFIVAEAWDGKHISGAISRFLRMAAGHDPCAVKIGNDPNSIRAGGDSAVVAFVGHNGLVDFTAPCNPEPRVGARPRSSIVLACASKPYFLDLLREGGSHPLLLTTGLMAPEAYSLEAALAAFAAGGSPENVHEAAASSYDRFQHCGKRGALNLFYSQP
jgi:hypothetical protein